MRTYFNEELEELSASLIDMGKCCLESIEMTSRVLSSHNREELEDICKKSIQISNRETVIETLCNRLLLLQQPVATDLRQVSSSLKMANDLERIGINTGDIAEILLTGEKEQPCSYLLQMSGIATEMVREGLEALEKKDTALARHVIGRDDQMDELFMQFRGELTRGLLHESALVDQLMIGKYYERIADHMVNVAGWIVYEVEGRQILDAE